MSFRAVVAKAKQEKWKSCANGDGDGAIVQTYFQRRTTKERLKARCEREGISVSRFLSTLAEMLLEEGER